MKKGQIEFGWLFALIIGGAIIFLAVFFSGKIFQTASYQTEAEMTRSLDVIFNPFSSIRQAEVSMSKPVSLPQKTDFRISCNSDKDSQTMSILLEKSKKPFSYSVKNKYIFAENFNQKDIWIFSKPFEMPWRVDDLIYIISKDYCFVNSPEDIKKELNGLNSSFIKAVDEIRGCKSDDIKVCFAITGCDVYIDYMQKTVKTSRKTMPFLDDSTMLGAVFDQSNYDCNLKRLLSRLDLQTAIMIEKANIISSRGCYDIGSTNPDLIGLKGALSAKNYHEIISYAESIDSANRGSSCRLY